MAVRPCVLCPPGACPEAGVAESPVLGATRSWIKENFLMIRAWHSIALLAVVTKLYSDRFYQQSFANQSNAFKLALVERFYERQEWIENSTLDQLHFAEDGWETEYELLHNKSLQVESESQQYELLAREDHQNMTALYKVVKSDDKTILVLSSKLDNLSIELQAAQDKETLDWPHGLCQYGVLNGICNRLGDIASLHASERIYKSEIDMDETKLNATQAQETLAKAAIAVLNDDIHKDEKLAKELHEFAGRLDAAADRYRHAADVVEQTETTVEKERDETEHYIEADMQDISTYLHASRRDGTIGYWLMLLAVSLGISFWVFFIDAHRTDWQYRPPIEQAALLTLIARVAVSALATVAAMGCVPQLQQLSSYGPFDQAQVVVWAAAIAGMLQVAVNYDGATEVSGLFVRYGVYCASAVLEVLSVLFVVGCLPAWCASNVFRLATLGLIVYYKSRRWDSQDADQSTVMTNESIVSPLGGSVSSDESRSPTEEMPLVYFENANGSVSTVSSFSWRSEVSAVFPRLSITYPTLLLSAVFCVMRTSSLNWVFVGLIFALATAAWIFWRFGRGSDGSLSLASSWSSSTSAAAARPLYREVKNLGV